MSRNEQQYEFEFVPDDDFIKRMQEAFANYSASFNQPEPATIDADHIVLVSTLHTQRTSWISGAHDRWPFRDWLRKRTETLDHIKKINNAIAARKTKITFL